MGRIKPHRVIYTRIGAQESWSGWKIAGFTTDVPNDILFNCTKLQGKNSDKSKFMYDKYRKDNVEAAKEVYEFFCDFDGSVNSGFSFTRMMFGDSDDGGRTSMISYSLALPFSMNKDIVKCPEKLLLIDRQAFSDSQLNVELFRKASGKNNISVSDVQTKLELKDYDFSEDFDLVSEVSNLFGSKKIYCDFIKCVYWNLTFKSSSSIFVLSDGDLDKNIRVFLTAFKSIIHSFRNKLSFRTFDFEDSNNQPTIVFCDRIPNGVKYFDINTGENNILSESISLKLKRDSMEFFPNNYDKPTADRYFDLLEETIEEFGAKDSTEISVLETAYIFAHGELEESTDDSDKDIMRKIISFCKLPYSSEKIDKVIAELLDSVINENLALNDDIRRYIDDKLKATKCKELIEVGNQYRALTLLKDHKEKAYARLMDIRNNDTNYNKILEYILLEPQGSAFLDEFYGTYYGHSLGTLSGAELREYYQETKNLSYRPKINKFIESCCLKFGESLINEFYTDNKTLVGRMETLVGYIKTVLPNDGAVQNRLVEQLKSMFWSRFQYGLYSYEHIDSYEYMLCTDPRKFQMDVLKKSAFVRKITDIFKTVQKGNPNTVRAFQNQIEECGLTQVEKNSIIVIFQNHCLRYCDKTKNLDLWIALASLSGKTKFEFLFTNDIELFVDVELFQHAIHKSEDMKKPYKVKEFSSELRTYYLNENKTKQVATILSIVNSYESTVEKEHRHKRVDPKHYSSEKKGSNHENDNDTNGEKVGRIKNFFGIGKNKK